MIIQAVVDLVVDAGLRRRRRESRKEKEKKILQASRIETWSTPSINTEKMNS